MTDTRNNGGPAAIQVGDLVRVISNVATEHPHEIEIGTVLPVQAVFEDGSGVDLGEWACRFDEIEPLSTPTEGPASQTEGMGGEVKAKAKQALYSLRFEGQPMSSMFSAEELGLIVDTVSAALSTPTEGPASQTEDSDDQGRPWKDYETDTSEPSPFMQRINEEMGR